MLTVIDSVGTESVPARTPIAVNSRPVALLTATPLSGPVGLNVDFDASASSDADSGDRIVEYLWDFGDGTHMSTTSSQTHHAYVGRGRHRATVVVVDALSAQSPPASVEVVVGTPPTARITSNTTFPDVISGSGFVQFSAAGSFAGDPNAPIVKYLWTRGGITQVTTEPRFGSNFSTVGEFEVTLVVEDSDGLRSAPASITIRPQGLLQVRLFEDLNGNELQDDGESTIPRFPTTYSVFRDTNRDGTPQPNELSSAFNTSGAASLRLGSGTHSVQLVMPPHVVATLPTSGSQLVSLDGLPTRTVSFGVFRLGRVTIQAFEDARILNNQLDSFESRTIASFWDQDQDGQFDDGEPSGAAFADLPLGTHQFRLVPSPGLVPLGLGFATVKVSTSGFVNNDVRLGFIRLGSISGVAFTDQNGNRSKESTEPVITNLSLYLDENHNGVHDPTEPTTLSNSLTGAYAFTQVVRPSSSAATAPVVRPLALPASQQVTNLGGGVAAQLSSGVSLTNKNLGVFTRGSASGRVFEDVNGDNQFNTGDRLLATRTVYVDANNNGSPDSNEPSTTEDTHLAFSIDDCRFSIGDDWCQVAVALYKSKIKNHQSKISPPTSPSARST